MQLIYFNSSHMPKFIVLVMVNVCGEPSCYFGSNVISEIDEKLGLADVDLGS